VLRLSLSDSGLRTVTSGMTRMADYGHSGHSCPGIGIPSLSDVGN